MKVAVLAYGDLDPILLSLWLKLYLDSGSEFEPILFHDKTLNSTSKKIWAPHQTVEAKENIKLTFNCNLPGQDIFRGNILRSLAYRYLGDCFICDVDALIVKKITDFPDCKFGLVQKTDISRTIKEAKQPIPHLIFDEFSFVNECYSSPQIIKCDIFDDFTFYLNKYKSKMYDLPGTYHQYFESILCLVHKLKDGVYLQPEWNWMFDSDIKNDNIKVIHYFGEHGKWILKQKYLNQFQIKIN